MKYVWPEPPCCSRRSPIAWDSESIFCSYCDSWYHTIFLDAKQPLNFDSFGWICDKCLTADLSDLIFGDKSSRTLNSDSSGPASVADESKVYFLLRKDRVGKFGGGIAAYCKNNLTFKRRKVLECDSVEILWLEICPYKSNRSLLMAGRYRPGS